MYSVLVFNPIRAIACSLSLLLEGLPECRVGVSWGQEEELLQLLQKAPIDLILVACAALAARCLAAYAQDAIRPDFVVLGVSGPGSFSHSECICPMPADASLREVAHAARRILGNRSTSGRSVGDGARHPATPALRGQLAVTLSRREEEVLRLVESGAPNAVIARRLGIKVSTAKVHVHHILEKLQVGNRAEAAATSRRLPLLSPAAQPEVAARLEPLLEL